MKCHGAKYIRSVLNLQDILKLTSQFTRFVLVHNTRSNDAQFMHDLCLSLDSMNRVMGGHSPHLIEKLKHLTE